MGWVKAARASHSFSLRGSLTTGQVGRESWRMQEHRPSLVSLMLVAVEVVVTAVMLVVVDAGACALAVRPVRM